MNLSPSEPTNLIGSLFGFGVAVVTKGLIVVDTVLIDWPTALQTLLIGALGGAGGLLGTWILKWTVTKTKQTNFQRFGSWLKKIW